jgi:hypothetical protein
MEAHSEGMLCTIFLIDVDGQHMHYAAAPSLPEPYRAATDGLRGLGPMRDHAVGPPTSGSRFS